MDNDKEKQVDTDKEKQVNTDKESQNGQAIADAITAGFNSLIEALSGKDSNDKTADDSDKVDTEKEAMKEQLKIVLQTNPSAFTYENYRKVKKLVAD